MTMHYAAISNDFNYTPPLCKQNVNPVESEYISEWQVFQILDHLRPTATGLDGLPAWFLRLGAPVFYQPIAYLFNLSIATSTVPQQWKQASIIPIPKTLPTKQLADFRPISITPVLTRIMEKTVVRHFIYPAIQAPPATLSLSGQFAFRSTSSPTATIIFFLNTITNMLLSNPFARHSTR